jgi:hypothetical protein
LASAGGNQRAELGELKGTEKGIESAADPDSEEEPGVGENGGDAAGGAYDAYGDGVADRDGYAEADAEDLKEFALVWTIGGVSRRRLNGARG